MARLTAYVAFGLLVTPSAAEAQGLKLVDSISGESFLAIQTALPELANQGLSVDGYTITVWRTPRAIAVMFQNPVRRPVAAGAARKPNIQVELPLPPPPAPPPDD